MFFLADLHLHSRYAQAASQHMCLETLYQWARVKGIQVMGTGDFTHPGWFSELQEKLVGDDSGLYRLKAPPAAPALTGMNVKELDVRFCLSAEICTEYMHEGKLRKNHHLVYAPDFEVAGHIAARLSGLTDLAADGRPTIGLSSRDLLEVVMEASDRAYLVPAHVWTPWFSTLGAVDGYDSVDACYRDLSPYLFALETGLSSDPAMNWRWSALDRFTLLSNSDAHLPKQVGRQVNVFETALSYDGLFIAVKTGNGFLGTYELFPEEGRYYFDGHRACGVSFDPKQAKQHKGLCSQCGQLLQAGVLSRVQKLADRKVPKQPDRAADFRYSIPLQELLAEVHGMETVDNRKVRKAFIDAISSFGNEHTLLQTVPVEDIRRHNRWLGEAVRRMRSGEVFREPGYDGQYGRVTVFENGEPTKPPVLQLSLFA